MPDVDRIREHFAARLAESRVSPFPFPHLEVENVFPDDVYQRILAAYPFDEKEGREWITLKEQRRRRQTTPFHLRRLIDIQKELEELPDAARSVFGDVSRALMEGDWFAQQICAKYPEYFQIRFGEAMADDRFFARLENRLTIHHHERGFKMGAHTDGPHRVFTGIFAFAPGPGYEDYGTELMRPRDPDVRCYGDLTHDRDEFERAKLAPYSPNRLLVMFKTRQSFHSVREIDRDIPQRRYGMQLAYYEPSKGVFRELSRPELMRDKSSRPIFSLSLFGKHLHLENE